MTSFPGLVALCDDEDEIATVVWDCESPPSSSLRDDQPPVDSDRLIPWRELPTDEPIPQSDRRISWRQLPAEESPDSDAKQPISWLQLSAQESPESPAQQSAVWTTSQRTRPEQARGDMWTELQAALAWQRDMPTTRDSEAPPSTCRTWPEQKPTEAAPASGRQTAECKAERPASERPASERPASERPAAKEPAAEGPLALAARTLPPSQRNVVISERSRAVYDVSLTSPWTREPTLDCERHVSRAELQAAHHAAMARNLAKRQDAALRQRAAIEQLHQREQLRQRKLNQWLALVVVILTLVLAAILWQLAQRGLLG